MVETNMTLIGLIEAADVEGLRAALAANPGLADRPLAAEPVPGHSPHVAPPIHHICDRVFDKRLTQEQGLALAMACLEAGANPDARSENGDSLLITAVSLTAQPIAMELLRRGADISTTGAYGATALHWACLLGFPHVAEALIRLGAPLTQEDSEFGSTPVGWALEGWVNGSNGGTRDQPACVALLRKAGVKYDTSRIGNALDGDEHQAMRDALGMM